MSRYLRYLHVVKASFMSAIIYPMGTFFTLIGNLVYITVVFFLWHSIYSGQDTLHGMTFNQTFIYLTLAGSVLILFKTYTDWAISSRILDGSIVTDLIKPLDFQAQTFAGALGFALVNGVLITLPSLVLMFVFFHGSFPIGINILFFPISLGLAFVMSFCLDYVVGLTSFYTQSLWGISITKEVIVSVLSGALIPLAFFPVGWQRVLQLLPFQAIYSIPLLIATSSQLQIADYFQLLLVQIAWTIVFLVLTRLFFNRAIRVLVVNGG